MLTKRFLPSAVEFDNVQEITVEGLVKKNKAIVAVSEGLGLHQNRQNLKPTWSVWERIYSN
jgi:hypothetical protein